MDQTPEPDNAAPQGQSPDGDLALAFFGSIGCGLVTPVIPFLLFQWMPGRLVLFSMLGGLVGFLWGCPTVIVAAAVGRETRRAATFWMLAMLGAGTWMICWFYRGAVAHV